MSRDGDSDGRAAWASGASDGVDADPEVSGKTAFVRALNVPRNARLGMALGVLFTVAVYAFFVVIPGTYRSPAWYVALAFVLALSMGGLFTVLLTLVSAYRLSREL